MLRAHGRGTNSLTKWPSAATKGIPSMKAIRMNAEALLLLAEHWCPLISVAKSPSVPILREELGSWREEMQLEADPVVTHLDAWGLRRLFSLAIRRRGSSRRHRDSVTEAFFETLCAHWGGGPEVPDEDDSPEADEDPYPEVSDDDDSCLDVRRVAPTAAASRTVMDFENPITPTEPEDDSVMFEPENLMAMSDDQLLDEEIKLLAALRIMEFLHFAY